MNDASLEIVRRAKQDGPPKLKAALRQHEGQLRSNATHLLVDTASDKRCKRTLKYVQEGERM